MEINPLPINSTSNTAKPLKKRQTATHITILFSSNFIICKLWLVKTDNWGFLMGWDTLYIFHITQLLSTIRAEIGAKFIWWCVPCNGKVYFVVIVTCTSKVNWLYLYLQHNKITCIFQNSALYQLTLLQKKVWSNLKLKFTPCVFTLIISLNWDF